MQNKQNKQFFKHFSTIGELLKLTVCKVKKY